MQSQYKKRKQKEKIKGRIIIVFILLLILAIGVLSFNLRKEKDAIDKTTNCPRDGANHHSAVLIDISQDYNRIQKISIQNHLETIINETEKYEKVSVYTVGADFLADESLRPLMSKCNPRGSSKGNPLFENPEKIEKDWTKEFTEPLVGVFNDLLNNQPKGPSPIMEMIQAISVAAFQKDKPSAKKKLFIFSDMLQNYGRNHHYKSDFNFQEFSDSSIYLRVRTDLTGVTIRVLYVRRLGGEKFQKGTAHAKFWQEYFNSMGAEGYSIKFIEG